MHNIQGGRISLYECENNTITIYQCIPREKQRRFLLYENFIRRVVFESNVKEVDQSRKKMISRAGPSIAPKVPRVKYRGIIGELSLIFLRINGMVDVC